MSFIAYFYPCMLSKRTLLLIVILVGFVMGLDTNLHKNQPPHTEKSYVVCQIYHKSRHDVGLYFYFRDSPQNRGGRRGDKSSLRGTRRNNFQRNYRGGGNYSGNVARFNGDVVASYNGDFLGNNGVAAKFNGDVVGFYTSSSTLYRRET